MKRVIGNPRGALARYQMLATAARDLVNEQVRRLTTKGGVPKRSSTNRLDAVFHHADWKNSYFLFDTELDIPLGRAFRAGGDPDAPEDQAEDAKPKVYPNAPKRIIFAVKVPPGESVNGLELRLTEHSSQQPLVTFLVAVGATLSGAGPVMAVRQRAR